MIKRNHKEKHVKDLTLKLNHFKHDIEDFNKSVNSENYDNNATLAKSAWLFTYGMMLAEFIQANSIRLSEHINFYAALNSLRHNNIENINLLKNQVISASVCFAFAVSESELQLINER